MRTIELNGREYQIAECWNELSQPQLLSIADNYLLKIGHFYRDFGAGMEPVSNEMVQILDMALFYILLGVKFNDYLKLDAYQIHHWIVEEKVVDFIKFERNLTKNPFQRIGNLQGPSDDFMDMEAEEYFVAKHNLECFLGGDMTALDAFIAILFRPRGKDGRRIAFRLDAVDRDATRVKGYPLSKKIIMKLWFESTILQLQEVNPEAFEGRGQSGDFYDMLLQVANEGTFGGYKETVSTNVNLIFKEICRVVKTARELEEKYRK